MLKNYAAAWIQLRDLNNIEKMLLDHRNALTSIYENNAKDSIEEAISSARSDVEKTIRLIESEFDINHNSY